MHVLPNISVLGQKSAEATDKSWEFWNVATGYMLVHGDIIPPETGIQ
jgi:hypothetical protein